jgi:hypothetical protein
MSIPRCSVCFSNHRAAIDAALVEGAPLVPTAAKFGLSKSALGRHRIGCLSPQLAAAAKMVAPSRETRAPVERAKAIIAGSAPTAADALSLGGLLSTLGRSLERLEVAADLAAGEKALAALAAISGQLHRGIEAAAKVQGIGSQPNLVAAGSMFSVTINLGVDARPERAAVGWQAPYIDLTDGWPASADDHATG